VNGRRWEPAYEAGETVEICENDVGAWCWIGGGQGALSQACKETGVACRPSKQLNHNSFARESNVVRLMSKPLNRKMGVDSKGAGKSREKWSPKAATKRAFSNEPNPMDVGAWICAQGILIRPTNALQSAENQG